MTQEEKQLLLQVLSAMLPYGVICHYNCIIPCDGRLIEKTNAKDVLKGIIPMSDGHIGFMIGIDKVDALEGDIKPYLRSMNSMTEDERKVYIEISSHLCGEIAAKTMIDWLNKKMFDYCGLIPMGLAYEAPEGMYN